VIVRNTCYILSDGDAVPSSGMLDKASVVGKVNDLEQYVLKVTPVKASACAASTRIAGEAELWHRRFNHLGSENLKLAATMVDGMLSSVADANRVNGTVCVQCVDGKMVQSPSPRSSTATPKCELVHTDIGGPLTEALGDSLYFMTALEASTGFITATPIKKKKMAPEVLKTRITQLETLTGVKVKRFRLNGAKEYVSNNLKAWYEDKGITSAMTAPYKSQQNGKAKRVNRTLMERVRAALLDAGAEEKMWAEALASVVHVLNRSPKAGLDVTPLEALTGRLPNLAGLRVSGSRAWALKPNMQLRKLEPRTDVCRFVGYTVGGKAYRILEDEKNQVFERRDVLMEENSAKVETSAVGSSAGPRLTTEYDGDKDGATQWAMDMLGSEGGREDEYSPDDTSDSDNEFGPSSFAGDSQKEHEDGVGGSTPSAAQAPAASDSVTPGPRCSKRKPTPKVTWLEKEPKAYLASGNAYAAQAGWDLHMPPATEKEARARPDWLLWKQALKEEVAAHKHLGTWSKTKKKNKNHKAIKTLFVFDIKHDAEGKLTR